MSTLNRIIATCDASATNSKVIVVLLSLAVYGCHQIVPVDPSDSNDSNYSSHNVKYTPIPTITYVGDETMVGIIDGVLEEIDPSNRIKKNARDFLVSPDSNIGDNTKSPFGFFRQLSVDDQLDNFLNSILSGLKLADEFSYDKTDNILETNRVVIRDSSSQKVDGFLSNLFSSIPSFVLMTELRLLGEETAGDDPKNVGKFIVDTIKRLNPPVLDRCQVAFERRLSEFSNGVGTDYDSFGMVVYDTVRPYHPADPSVVVADGGAWAGELYMCSWIGLIDNYYYEFGFLSPDESGTANTATNMPLTLVSTAEILPPNGDFPSGASIPNGVIESIQNNGWKWKLHATGDRIHVHKAIVATSEMLLGTDITSEFEIDSDCIDIFFKEIPVQGDNGSYFSTLKGYCNGRCDRAIVNSGI